ncbi:uncharacterized protein AAG666_001778 isoform 2-T2 [Megaptera novaeangliae]
MSTSRIVNPTWREDCNQAPHPEPLQHLPRGTGKQSQSVWSESHLAVSYSGISWHLRTLGADYIMCCMDCYTVQTSASSVALEFRQLYIQPSLYFPKRNRKRTSPRGEYFRLIRHTLLQGSISFEDVTVNFTQEEWGQLDPDQRTLCRALHYQTRGDLQVRARSTMDIRGRICKPLLPR